ncbi:MAG: glycoside hydrolase family 127 protein, partial [Kiritimatiellae bacterium]|nr:glycoside hydrolase family 127 protein [Kiritimatiellia bacterium]
QEPGGYIGNYAPENRYSRGWDVWGTKYTLMGLMHYYDYAARDPSLKPSAAEALEAAKRLCDYLIAERGPKGRTALRFTGQYGGLPSLSVLEPVVWLYNRTKEPRFLAFADYIVKQMTEYPDGPELVKQSDVPVADRRLTVVDKYHSWNPEHALTKAYELMSCYQGLIEYYQATGRKEYLDAAVKTAKSIATTEINLAGGGAAGEHWFHGADQQWRHISWQQETCVITTWMRLCEKLRAVTGDPYWSEQLEKTFYNAYLGALNYEADTFAAYTPLMGSRAPGHHHCRLHTNCCNANGPRGWLCVLNRAFTAAGDVATLDFYMSGLAEADLPALGKKARFRLYTLYPREERVTLTCESETPTAFALRLRIPSFAEGASVKINGKPVDVQIVAGGYCELRRTWRNGEIVELTLPMPVKMHRLHDHVAFTRGPVCLARDTRFHDGELDEEVREWTVKDEDLAAFRLTRADDPAMFMSVTGFLPMGSHDEDKDQECHPRAVHFTDYASAGNVWRPDNRYRVWLPALIRGRTY